MRAWIAPIWGYIISIKTPVMWIIGFLIFATAGGITGYFLSQAPIDRAFHDTYYVVAHLHYVMTIGLVFVFFAAVYFWFGKMTGRRYPEFWGKIHFWMMFIGASLTFFPQHFLGRQGMPRRYIDYAEQFATMNALSTAGATLFCASFILFFAIVLYSLLRGQKVTGHD